MQDLTLAEALKYLRSKKNMSARRLSLAAGLSASYVGKVESGELLPSLNSFARIAGALDMSDVEILFLVRLVEQS